MFSKTGKVATTASIAIALGLLLTSCGLTSRGGEPSPEVMPAPTDPALSASTRPPTPLDPSNEIPEEIVVNDEAFGHYISNELLVSVKGDVSIREALKEVSEDGRTFLAGEDSESGQFKIVFEESHSLADLQRIREDWAAETDLFEDVRLNSWY